MKVEQALQAEQNFLDPYYNLVQHDRSETPFVDKFAHFNLGFEAGSAFGIQRLGLRGTPFIYQLLDPACLIYVKKRGASWQAFQRQACDSWPWMTRERSHVEQGLLMESEHQFVDENTAVSSWRLVNTTQEEVVFDVALAGVLQPDHEIGKPFRAPFPDLDHRPLSTELRDCIQGIAGGLHADYRPDPDLVEASFALQVSKDEHLKWSTCLGAEPFYTGHGELSCRSESVLNLGPERAGHYALLNEGSVSLSAGQELLFQTRFSVKMSSKSSKQRDHDPQYIDSKNFDLQCFDGLDFAKFRDTNRRAYMNLSRSEDTFELKSTRAKCALLRSGLKGLDGEFGDNIACLCTSDSQFFSTSFFWDALFSSAAISDFNPEYARGAIRSVFVRQSERDGTSPENLWNHNIPFNHNRVYPQAPVASWAVGHYLKQNPEDLNFLRDILPKLVNNHRYWMDFGDADGDGLAEWRWSGQTADDSPLYDPYANGGQLDGCQWLPPIASVHLNCFLYRDAKLLESFHETLGLKDGAEFYRQRQLDIWEAFQRVCYDEQSDWYWDYNHATGHHRKVKTFYMFWPILAGFPLPESKVRQVVEEHLLNPEQFFGAMPFPSVSYDEPDYDPKGYWRGKSWPHISYWLLEVLQSYGYEKEADQAADRILAWVSRQPGFRENLESDTALAQPTGHMDYNWGCAAAYLLNKRMYKRFTVG